MKPKQSYRIWFSQRNGSTLLCKGIEQTGIAGKPGEYFNVMEAQSLCEKYQVKTYTELRAAIWQLGTTENKIFGIKHSMHATRYAKIFREISELQGIAYHAELNYEDLLADLFQNCKHIYLTRRNKIRQAVSWWKAIKDNVWHLESNAEQKSKAAFYEENYDFAALSHLFKEATLRECIIQEYFTKYEIKPLTLVYEDFIQDFKKTIHQIVEYLEIDYEDLEVEDMYYKKTANSYSEQWVQRFREDLQKEMEDKIW